MTITTIRVDEETGLLAELRRRMLRKGRGPFPGVESVANTAHLVSLAMREMGPADVYDTLAALAARRPERVAQVMMALAAWVDPDEPMARRHVRVDAITALHPELHGAA